MNRAGPKADTKIMYKALLSDLTVRKSDIHGLGVFARRGIPKDTILGISHVKDKSNTGCYKDGYIRTPLGGFINHSNEPNCIKVKVLGTWFLPLSEGELSSTMAVQTNKAIREGEEITVSYTLYTVD